MCPEATLRRLKHALLVSSNCPRQVPSLTGTLLARTQDASFIASGGRCKEETVHHIDPEAAYRGTSHSPIPQRRSVQAGILTHHPPQPKRHAAAQHAKGSLSEINE